MKLDAELLRKVHIPAATQGTSISALLAERLEKMVREGKAYEEACRRALSRLKQGFELRWTPPVRGTNCMSDKSSWTQTFWSMRTTARQAKHSRARQLGEDLWNSGLGVLSTLVLQELCVSVRRKARGPLSVEETRRLVEDYFNWEAVINTPASVTQALELEARYKFSFWDALILQAAETAGVAILYWARFVPRSMQIVAGR